MKVYILKGGVNTGKSAWTANMLQQNGRVFYLVYGPLTIDKILRASAIVKKSQKKGIYQDIIIDPEGMLSQSEEMFVRTFFKDEEVLVECFPKDETFHKKNETFPPEITTREESERYWIAFLTGKREKYGWGQTEAEAIGKLHLNHPEIFGAIGKQKSAMTVKELRNILEKCSDDDIIIIAKTNEGVEYAPVGNHSYDRYQPDQEWSGNVKTRISTENYITENNIVDSDFGPPCLTLYPGI